MNTYNSFSELAASQEPVVQTGMSVFNMSPVGMKMPAEMQSAYQFYAIKENGKFRVTAVDVVNDPNGRPFYVTPMQFDTVEDAQVFANGNLLGKSHEKGKMIKLDLSGG